MGVVADMSWSSQPQKSISPALPGFFVKRSHEIQRSSQPEMWLHNPSEAKRKNTIIFSLVDHDCLLNMLPKKGGSGFSNLNPIHFHLQKTTPPRFFLYHLDKTWCIEGFPPPSTWDWRVPTTQLEIGIFPPPPLRLELPTLGKKLPTGWTTTPTPTHLQRGMHVRCAPDAPDARYAPWWKHPQGPAVIWTCGCLVNTQHGKKRPVVT